MRISLLAAFCFIYIQACFCQKTEYIDSLRTQLSQCHTNNEKFENYFHQSIYFYQRGLSDSMNKKATKLLSIAKEAESDSMLCMAYGVIGAYYDAQGDFDTAFNFYNEGMELGVRAKYEEGQGFISKNMAWTHIERSDFVKSILEGNQAIDLLKKVETKLLYKIGIPIVYDNLAKAYVGLHKIDSALEYAQRANIANQKLNSQYVQGFINCEFGSIYELQKQYDLAESYYKNTLVNSKTSNTLLPICQASLQYSALLLLQNRTREAKEIAKAGFDAAVRGEYKAQVIDHASILRKIYDQAGKTDSAYYYSKIEINYRDTVFSDKKNVLLSNGIFQEESRQIEMQRKKEEAEHKREEQIKYITIAIAIGILMIVVFFFILFSLKKSNSLVVGTIKYMIMFTLLAFFEFCNLLIHKSAAELTHESPYMMMLCLIVAALILTPIHHRLEKWIEKKALDRQAKKAAQKEAKAKQTENPGSAK